MEDYIIDVNNVTVRFNKANMKVDNIKEYVVRLLRHELMFQEFIALKDINLQIKKGEAWGFVGTNGAGKSTLLKVISRILKPYKGSVDVKGSVAALIELGAGIDPNLTARENIYLNGTLLGYKKSFIEEKFDEIVEFSELKDFLDSPVKNFSSGMKARLGFSIATSERMRNMLKNGTTLLYVSHNMKSIEQLCDKALWLDHGVPVMQGTAKEVCAAYNKKMEA